LQVTNLSNWRRTVCGDLTSVFKKYKQGKEHSLEFLDMDDYVKQIYGAKFKEIPSDYKSLSKKEIQAINKNPESLSFMSQQEPGVRSSCGLPYELYVGGRFSKDKKGVELTMQVGNKVFGSRSSGAPFKVYAPDEYVTLESEKKQEQRYERTRAWDYAVTAGDEIVDTFPLSHFKGGSYHLCVYGPNGFFREVQGDENDPKLQVETDYERSRILRKVLTGNIVLACTNEDNNKEIEITITDRSYKNPPLKRAIPAGESMPIVLNLKKTSGWYDFEISVKGKKNYSQRFAGHVETGKESISDPLMGREIG